MEWFFGWLIFAGVVAYIANSRGRLPFDYFLLSALLSPLIGAIVLLAKPNLAEEARKSRQRRAEQDRQIEALKSTQSQDEDDANVRLNKSNSANFVADELAKLADLRDKGILTNEEFQTRKSLLLR